MGLLAGLEFVSPPREKQFASVASVGREVARAAMKEGLILYPSSNSYKGYALDFISIAPPLIVSNAQIDELITKLETAISKAEV
jgi:adenosylmethionine-8-amino-7-oxononanoate aminotransferase